MEGTTGAISAHKWHTEQDGIAVLIAVRKADDQGDDGTAWVWLARVYDARRRQAMAEAMGAFSLPGTRSRRLRDAHMALADMLTRWKAAQITRGPDGNLMPDEMKPILPWVDEYAACVLAHAR